MLHTYDGAPESYIRASNLGQKLPMKAKWMDSTGRVRFADSTGAFLIGQLEQLDRTLNEPLFAVTFHEDAILRTDVSVGHAVASFTLSTFAASGGLGTGSPTGGGKSWIGNNTSQIPGGSVDLAKIPQALRLWGFELKYTIPELESSALLGQGIDTQKYEVLQAKWQLDSDAQFYIGDNDYGDTGLFNASRVTNVASVATGANGNTTWATKTPREILDDFNEVIVSAWAATGYKVMPNQVSLPPAQFGSLGTQFTSEAGTQSILKYLLENNVLMLEHGQRLEVRPRKWLVGAGTGGTLGTAGTVDRMVAWRKDKKFLQFPRTPMQKTPLQYQSIYHSTTYFAKIGQLEVRYPETIAYRDGI